MQQHLRYLVVLRTNKPVIARAIFYWQCKYKKINKSPTTNKIKIGLIQNKTVGLSLGYKEQLTNHGLTQVIRSGG